MKTERAHGPGGVVAFISQANKFLVGVRDEEPYKEMMALPGGHIETGETAHEALKRELKEEAGVDVDIAQEDPAHTIVQELGGARMIIDVYRARIVGGWLTPQPGEVDHLVWATSREFLTDLEAKGYPPEAIENFNGFLEREFSEHEEVF